MKVNPARFCFWFRDSPSFPPGCYFDEHDVGRVDCVMSGGDLDAGCPQFKVFKGRIIDGVTSEDIIKKFGGDYYEFIQKAKKRRKKK